MEGRNCERSAGSGAKVSDVFIDALWLDDREQLANNLRKAGDLPYGCEEALSMGARETEVGGTDLEMDLKELMTGA